MSKPKQQLPGQCAEISRRTGHRTYYWRPGEDTRDLFGYMFAKALNDTGQQAHVASLMSNHTHILLTDVEGSRSKFMQQLFSNSARKRNLQLNRRENIWAPGAPGDMAVLEVEKIVERVLYVALQAVAAGCVERVEDWTGFRILPRDWGKPMVFRRPRWCNDDMPEFVEFTPMPPPGFQHLLLDEVIAFFNDLIARKERRYARKRKRSVLGIEVCEAMSPFYTPKTNAPMRTLNPRFSAADKSLIFRALQRQRRFRNEHRESLDQFRNGRRNAEFPAGTIQMARLAGATCKSAGANHPFQTRTSWTAGLRAQWDDWLVRRAA
jgi:REP element-mobilizing transposase RayT